jgi:ribose-phosphate pyrophosphokinase
MSTPRINVFNETMTRQILTAGEEIEFMTFPSGEPHVKLQHVEHADLYNRKVVVDARIGNYSDMGHLYGLVELLVHSGAILETLLVPRFPGARADRGVPFGAKMFSDQFRALNFRRILTLEPHSQVCLALSGAQTLAWQPNLGGTKYSHLVIPDAGASARAGGWQKYLGIKEAIQVFKERDFTSGELSGFRVEQMGNQLMHKGIIVDDCCDYGGTFMGAAKVVREKFPHMALDLFVAHGTFPGDSAEKLLDVFGRVYASTSSRTASELVSLGITPLKVHPNESTN